MKSISIAIALAWGTAVAAAQSNQHDVPPTAAAGDQGSALQIPGFDRNARMQVLIDEVQLTPMINRVVTGMSFRREADTASAFSGGDANIVVTLSPALRPAESPSRFFAQNQDTNPTRLLTVFAGIVALPPSPSPVGRQVSFANPSDVVSISFLAPYVYTGGTLCIDIIGEPVISNPSGYWAVDAALDPTAGRKSNVGTTCSLAGVDYPASSVAAAALIPGATAAFTGQGPALTPGAFLVGVPISPINLALLGLAGPGCTLHVQPFATVPVSFGNNPVAPTIGGAFVDLDIPAGTAALSLPFRTQFIAMSSPLVTSNAIDCVTADRAPTLAMSTVFANRFGPTAPTEGQARTNRSPVIRFLFQ